MQEKQRRLKTFIHRMIVFTLGLNLVFLIKDISDDVEEHAGFWHIGPEILIVLGTVATAILALMQYLKAKESADGFAQQVAELEKTSLNWQNRTKVYADGLSREIDRQLSDWDLTQAEKEIALLLLKGLSNREIAGVRRTSEQTIKQQSSSVYRKSGLNTRSELSAFFLEDLLIPTGSQASAPPNESVPPRL